MRRTAAERTRDGRASPAQQRRVVSEPGKVGEEGRGQAAVQGRAAGQRVRERLPGRCWSISAAAGRAPCLAGCSQRAPHSGSREGPWGDPGSLAPQRPLDCGGPGGHQGAGAARRTMAARPRREAGRAGERGPANGRARARRRRRGRAARAREGAAGAQGGRRRRGAGAEVGAGGGGGRAGSVFGSARQCGAVCRAAAARR